MNSKKKVLIVLGTFEALLAAGGLLLLFILLSQPLLKGEKEHGLKSQHGSSAEPELQQTVGRGKWLVFWV